MFGCSRLRARRAFDAATLHGTSPPPQRAETAAPHYRRKRGRASPRRKIAATVPGPDCIKSVYGVGHRFGLQGNRGLSPVC
jgi:hypothetical protein